MRILKGIFLKKAIPQKKKIKGKIIEKYPIADFMKKNEKCAPIVPSQLCVS